MSLSHVTKHTKINFNLSSFPTFIFLIKNHSFLFFISSHERERDNKKKKRRGIEDGTREIFGVRRVRIIKNAFYCLIFKLFTLFLWFCGFRTSPSSYGAHQRGKGSEMRELIDGNVYEYYYDDGTSVLMDDTKCLVTYTSRSSQNKWKILHFLIFYS